MPGRLASEVRAPPRAGDDPYSSKFFSALHRALVDAGVAAEKVKLLEDIGECACVFLALCGVSSAPIGRHMNITRSLPTSTASALGVWHTGREPAASNRAQLSQHVAAPRRRRRRKR